MADHTYRVITSYLVAASFQVDPSSAATCPSYPAVPSLATAFPFPWAVAYPSCLVAACPSFLAVAYQGTSAAVPSSVIASFAEESYQPNVESKRQEHIQLRSH